MAIISVGTNYPVAELVLPMHVIEHLAAVHDGLDAGDEVLRVLIRSCCDLLEFR